MKIKKIILATLFTAAFASFAAAENDRVPLRKVKAKPVVPAALAVAVNTDANSADKAAVPAAKKSSTPAGWTDDFAAAKKQANEEGKDLFVVFSGSDWCGWCIRLHDEVFSQDGFTEKLSEKFVPVFIDLPRDTDLLSDLAKKQNRPLAQQYKITGYPSALLMDSDGFVFARTGYAPGGAEKYLEMLAKISEDGKNSEEYAARKALAQIPENDGERIKKVDAILASLDPKTQIANVEFVEEVLAADPDGKLGYRSKYPYFTTVLPLEKQLQNEIKNLSELAQKEIEKSGVMPKTREEADALLSRVFAKNSAGMSAMRNKIDEAKKGFSEDSLCRGELDKMSSLVAQIFKVYGQASAEKQDAPEK